MRTPVRQRVLDVGYRRVARPMLFRMGGGDAETAHHRAIGALGVLGKRNLLLRALARLTAVAGVQPTTLFGVRFPNQVGVAAGVDKDGRALRAWSALGFGHIEAGTVTGQAQPGNPKPRLFRLPESGAIINRMGFNNSGAEALGDRVRALGGRGSVGVPLGISLGKSKAVPVEQSIGDYLTSLRAVHEVADYIAVNVSSPNTPGLRGLQDRGPLDELLGALTEQADLLAGPGVLPVPVLVKIAPDLTDEAIGEVLQVCADRRIAGVIAANTTLSRDGVASAEQRVAAEAGGLSGEPLRERALQVAQFVCRHTDLPVIGVGGISQAEHAMAMFDAGVSLVQLYSGFIYRGPALVAEILDARRGAEGRT